MNEWEEYARSEYDIVGRPSAKVRAMVADALGEIEDYWVEVGVGVPKVLFARGLPNEHLARFIDGSASAGKPLVLIDYQFAMNGDRDEIEVTLLHELGHAFYDSAYTDEERLPPDAEEEIVEALAYEMWNRSLDPDRVRAALEEAAIL